MKKDVSSKTAELGAMIRALAVKNKFGKKVFSDSFSKYFIGKQTSMPYFFNSLTSFFWSSFWKSGMNSVGFLLSLCRHRFVFDQIKHAIEKQIDQIIIVGAGFDTSFLMLNNEIKDVKLIEIDHPATQKRKKEIVEKKFQGFHKPYFISADLNLKSISESLDNGLLNKSKPTLVIIEGVLSYLGKDKIIDLIKDLKSISSNLLFVADYRKLQLSEQNNSLGKKWIKDFNKINEKYISFFSEEQMNTILSNEGFIVNQNIDLLDLWGKYSSLEINKKLRNFGGIFIARYEFKEQ